MQCPQCKNIVNVGETFCRKCGSPILGNQDFDKIGLENNNNYDYSKQGIVPNEYTTDDDLLKSFLGKESDRLLKNNSNILCLSALILGPFYLIYKKMYMIGISLLIILAMCYHYINPFFPLIVIISNLIIGFLYKRLYLWWAKKEINKLKNKNSSKKMEELNEICKSRKNIPIYIIILFVIIYICLCIFFLKPTN